MNRESKLKNKLNKKAQLFVFDSLSYFLILCILLSLLLFFLQNQSEKITNYRQTQELQFFALDYSEYLVSNLLAKKDNEKKRILENYFSQQLLTEKDFSPFLIKEIKLNNQILFYSQIQAKDCLYLERLVYDSQPKKLTIGVCYKQ